MPRTPARTELPSSPSITSVEPARAWTAWANDASRTTPAGLDARSQWPARISGRPIVGTAGAMAHSSTGAVSGPLARVAAAVRYGPATPATPLSTVTGRVSVPEFSRSQTPAPRVWANRARHGLVAPSSRVADSNRAAITPAMT